MSESSPNLSVSVMAGPLSFQRDAASPLLTDLMEEFEALGYVNETTDVVETTYPNLPEFPADRPITNAVGLDELIIGFGLYATLKLSDAAIDQLAVDVYGNIVKPRLAAFWNRAAPWRDKNISLVFDHWFDDAGVLVRVEFRVPANSEAFLDLDLVREALKLAATRLQSLGVTHRVMTYTVSGGHLNGEPVLSQSATWTGVPKS